MPTLTCVRGVIRGFSGDINQGPDLLINRFSANRGFNARRDVATIERFEVLKGPASALSGKGEPGGSINIVTNAPLDRTHFSADLSAGSFATWRGAVDTGTPVGSQVKTRLIAVAERSDGFRDFTPSDRWLIAPSIAYAPRDTLRFLYQGEFNRVNFTHDRGLVAVNGDPLALPVTRFLGEPNDGHIYQTSTQHQLTATYDLSDSVSVEGGLAYRDGAMTGQSTHNRLLQADGLLRRQLRIHDYTWDDLSGRLELSALTQAFGLSIRYGRGSTALPTTSIANSGASTQPPPIPMASISIIRSMARPSRWPRSIPITTKT